MTKRRNVSREAEHGNRLITNSLFGAKKDCVSSCGFPESVKHSSNVPIGNLTQRSGVSLQVIATRPIPRSILEVSNERKLVRRPKAPPPGSSACSVPQNEFGREPGSFHSRFPAKYLFVTERYWLDVETGVTVVGAVVEVSGVEAACVAGVAATGAGGTDTAAVFGAVGVSVDTLRRESRGKNGVTSNGIFSRTDVNATAADLISSTLLSQGFSLTRPPRGSAAIWSSLFMSSCGARFMMSVKRVGVPLTAMGLPK